jgi:hypothetical protein
VRIFPNAASRLRLIRALAVERHENWPEAHRYLNMDDLREDKMEDLRRAARCSHDRPLDNPARCPQGPTTATATMFQFAEHSGHN